MLTIQAMVRIGPWVVRSIRRADQKIGCERCATPILEVWHCEVDAESPRLLELGGKRMWYIGSTCGPTLMLVSEQVWAAETKLVARRLDLVLRLDKVAIAAAARGNYPLPEMFAERRRHLVEGTIAFRLMRNLGAVLAQHERRLGL